MIGWQWNTAASWYRWAVFCFSFPVACPKVCPAFYLTWLPGYERPKTLPRRLNTLNPGLRPWPPRTPRSARSASPPSRVGAVQFDPLITVVTIPSIAELPAEKRGALHRGGAVKGLQWVQDECRFGVCRFGSFVFSRCCWVLKIPKFRILLETSSEKP